MRRTVSPGWASLFLSILLGFLPAGSPVVSAVAEWTGRAPSRSTPPLGSSHHDSIRDLKDSGPPSRHGWPLDLALPAAPFAAIVRTITVPVTGPGFDLPTHQKRVAFPYLTTGPPVSAL